MGAVTQAETGTRSRKRLQYLGVTKGTRAVT